MTEEEQGWLYLHIDLHGQEATETQIADRLTAIATERANFRLIVEFADEVLLNSILAGQLVLLHKRVYLQGGALRLCSFSDFNRDALRLMGLSDRFQFYPDRSAAAIP